MEAITSVLDIWRRYIQVTLAIAVIGALTLAYLARDNANDPPAAEGLVEAVEESTTTTLEEAVTQELGGVESAAGNSGQSRNFGDEDNKTDYLDTDSATTTEKTTTTASTTTEEETTTSEETTTTESTTTAEETSTTEQTTTSEPTTTTQRTTTTEPTTTTERTTTTQRTTTTERTTTTVARVALVNGGFDSVGVADGAYGVIDDARMNGWTSTSGQFEVWNNHRSVSAVNGNSFLELNVNEPTVIHQDFSTTPGSTIRWSFYHRGRNGPESVAVRLGPTGGSMSLVTTAETDQEWRRYTGTYVIPEGQRTTRISLASLEPGSAGNLIDAVTVSLD